MTKIDQLKHNCFYLLLNLPQRNCLENEFFKDVRPDLNLEKVNMPENTLFYINQGFLSMVKNGDIAMYVQNFILGQIIIAANQPKDIDEHVCLENEVKLLSCVYDIESGDFKGVREGTRIKCSYPMATAKLNQKFCIRIQSSRYLTPSFLLLLISITQKL